jgi:hypothetical protein
LHRKLAAAAGRAAAKTERERNPLHHVPHHRLPDAQVLLHRQQG